MLLWLSIVAKLLQIQQISPQSSGFQTYFVGDAFSFHKYTQRRNKANIFKRKFYKEIVFESCLLL